MPDGRSSIDDIIDLYKKEIDVSLIKENLKLTPDQRLQKLQRMAKFAGEARKAGEAMRQSKRSGSTGQ